MVYDPSNIFARILRGELPARKIYEDEYAMAFHDIRPLAPIHGLVIPKGDYVAFDDFIAKASPGDIAGFFRAVGKASELLGVTADGFRLLANSGAHAHQEVPHFHVHIFGGQPLGPMLSRSRD